MLAGRDNGAGIEWADSRSHLPVHRPMSRAEYRIDYAQVDVVDLMQQVRARIAVRSGADPHFPVAEEELRKRLLEYLVLDDDQPYTMQQALGLGGDWNVGPEDLRRSHDGPVGRLIRGVRTLLRPVTKLLVNTDMPIFKQFKLNIGVAAALHDLLEDNSRQRARLQELADRVERLEAGGSRVGRDA